MNRNKYPWKPHSGHCSDDHEKGGSPPDFSLFYGTHSVCNNIDNGGIKLSWNWHSWNGSLWPHHVELSNFRIDSKWNKQYTKRESLFLAVLNIGLFCCLDSKFTVLVATMDARTFHFCYSSHTSSWYNGIKYNITSLQVILLEPLGIRHLVPCQISRMTSRADRISFYRNRSEGLPVGYGKIVSSGRIKQKFYHCTRFYRTDLKTQLAILLSNYQIFVAIL